VKEYNNLFLSPKSYFMLLYPKLPSGGKDVKRVPLVKKDPFIYNHYFQWKMYHSCLLFVIVIFSYGMLSSEIL